MNLDIQVDRLDSARLESQLRLGLRQLLFARGGRPAEVDELLPRELPRLLGRGRGVGRLERRTQGRQCRLPRVGPVALNAEVVQRRGVRGRLGAALLQLGCPLAERHAPVVDRPAHLRELGLVDLLRRQTEHVGHNRLWRLGELIGEGPGLLNLGPQLADLAVGRPPGLLGLAALLDDLPPVIDQREPLVPDVAERLLRRCQVPLGLRQTLEQILGVAAGLLGLGLEAGPGRFAGRGRRLHRGLPRQAGDGCRFVGEPARGGNQQQARANDELGRASDHLGRSGSGRVDR